MGNVNIPPSNFGGPSPLPGPSPALTPLNFPAMPAGLSVEVIVKVPSRYYRVPRYFFTVLTVAHNRWYRPTLLECHANCSVAGFFFLDPTVTQILYKILEYAISELKAQKFS